MDRLTYFCDDGCGGGEYRLNEHGKEYAGESVDRLAAYENAEKEGRIIKTPCKVGDPVWYLTGNASCNVKSLSRIEESECTGILIEGDQVQIRLRHDWKGNHGSYGVFDKTVFATREAAEKAMEEAYRDYRQRRQEAGS